MTTHQTHKEQAERVWEGRRGRVEGISHSPSPTTEHKQVHLNTLIGQSNKHARWHHDRGNNNQRPGGRVLRLIDSIHSRFKKYQVQQYIQMIELTYLENMEPNLNRHELLLIYPKEYIGEKIIKSDQ
jgi:hypothetical protein